MIWVPQYLSEGSRLVRKKRLPLDGGLMQGRGSKQEMVTVIARTSGSLQYSADRSDRFALQNQHIGFRYNLVDVYKELMG